MLIVDIRDKHIIVLRWSEFPADNLKNSSLKLVTGPKFGVEEEFVYAKRYTSEEQLKWLCECLENLPFRVKFL